MNDLHKNAIPTIKNNNLLGAVLFSLLFLINPFLSLGCLIIFLMRSVRFNSFFLILLVFGLATYLALINTTKIPDSDLEIYLMWRNNAEYLNFFQYMTHQNREPLYFALDYILFFLFDGEPKPFVFFTTLIAYTFLLLSVMKISRVLHLDQAKIITLIIFMALFPQIFSISAHLIRQFLAASFVLYFLAKRMEKESPFNWIYYGAGLLIHSSAIVFPLLIFITGGGKNFKSFFSKKSIISLIVIAVGLVAVILVFGVEFLPYYRMEKNIDRELYDLGKFNYQQIILSCFVILISGYYYFQSLQDPISGVIEKEGLGLVLLLSTITLVVNFATSGLNTLSIRYFFYVYFLLPFPIGILISKIRYPKAFSYFFLIFIAMLFYYSLDKSIWEYAPVTSLIVCPLSCYF